MSQFNTIAGWALAGGIVALGASIVTSEMWHSERPEQMGYIVEGVEAAATEEEAGPSLEEALQMATVEQGESVFRRCTSCHTINQGGADGIGPNLYGIMGAPIAGASGFAYSDALAGMGGSWGWTNMSEWLERPAAFAEGTKMSFAGLSDVADRAAVILYMNAQGSNLPLPEVPEGEVPPEGDVGPGELEDESEMGDGTAAGESTLPTDDVIENEGDAAGPVERDE